LASVGIEVAGADPETAIRLALEAAVAGDQDAVSMVRLLSQRPPSLYN